MEKLKIILGNLNLLNKDGLFFYDDLENNITDFLTIRVKETLLEFLKPDAFFCINKEPLILFFENETASLGKKIWNFNQTPIVFINESNQWKIKNGFKFLGNSKKSSNLEILTEEQNISDFEYFKLITGVSWEKYKEHFHEKNRVDYYLLHNIEEARKRIISKGLQPKTANHLIGRVIFIRYLLDRKVNLNKYNVQNKEGFYEILGDHKKTYNFFNQVKTDFNGNLFPLEYEIDGVIINEKDKVTSIHLEIIINLLKGDKISKESTQPSLFDIYDFSIIPIEFVSNVYEKFIGVEKQADSGAYYTPLFLVDYIQKETVAKFFQKNPKEYNCKVLDPACGSGIFLVESLRQIIAKYKTLNPDFNANDKNYNEYKDKLKALLSDNIFGIDKDENAISVAIFSLYITLLDNLQPKNIVDFKFPQLLDTNFFVNDFFDVEKEFNTKLKKQHFQFILGNPPWRTKHPKEKQIFEKYIENRQKQENSDLQIVHREIAEAFLVRVSDFNFQETAFILVSKILYKLEKKAVFRKYFLSNFSIRQVLELSSVRHHVFNKSNDSAVAPAAILFYRKEKNIDEIRKNVIKHISLKPNLFFETFKLMVIEKYDVKEIAQKFFIDEDWIWKVLVYGNILDYYFIKRLKETYKTINDITSDNTKFIKGQGLKFKDGKRKISTEQFTDYDFIGSLDKGTNYNNFLRPFYLNRALVKWDGRDVGYFPKNPSIFNENTLLITDGLTNQFKAVSCIKYKKSLFKDSLTAINGCTINELPVLKAISSILNSSFFSYYILNMGSSTGIEREHSHDVEKWQVPFNINNSLVNTYEEVESLSSNYYFTDLHDISSKRQLDIAINKLDKEVISLFEISDYEKCLIDYTNTVTIPLLKGNKDEKKKVIRKINFKDDFLENYASVFVEHFARRFNSDGQFFEVEILWSDYTILMKFKIIPNPSKETNQISWNKIDSKQLLSNIINLGFENISDNLYMQKDIKGFEEDYFYVAKPNQYKSWHTALAHLDLSEFIEAFFEFNNGEKC